MRKNLNFIGFDKYEIYSNGKLYSHWSNKFLKTNMKSAKYNRATLVDEYGNKENWHIHRLVAIAFIPNNDPERVHVNHIDGNGKNNKVENLEWVTPKENVQHAIRTGLKRKFSRHGVRKYTSSQVHFVCRLIEQGLTNKQINLQVEIPYQKIAQIRAGTHYTDISKHYDFKKSGRSSRRKLTDEKVKEICELLQSGMGIYKVHKSVDSSYTTVKAIFERRIYTEISHNYIW